jgi:hypothetical protein
MPRDVLNISKLTDKEQQILNNVLEDKYDQKGLMKYGDSNTRRFENNTWLNKLYVSLIIVMISAVIDSIISPHAMGDIYTLFATGFPAIDDHLRVFGNTGLVIAILIDIITAYIIISLLDVFKLVKNHFSK